MVAKLPRLGLQIGVVLLSSLLSGCQNPSNAEEPAQNTSAPVTLRTALAQKLMLDFRYYCSPQQVQHFKGKPYCTRPMTTLPDDIKHLIAETNLGGVIWFSENLVDKAQVVALNHELQLAAASSASGLPLFIATDQEGGRVARLPRNISTPLSGNMAIGATYQAHGTRFAEQAGGILGAELKALGFNLNFAPTLDVNNNPRNPVINVRSFGESPSRVAELGSAMLKGMQQEGIIGTLKHFPGHGDTHVDSHTGLPRVDHNLARVMAQDVAPFSAVMSQQPVSAIMTANIQYPALDDSELINKDGLSMIRPATLSRKILTELLRGELGYSGLVITDALDMAGISDFLSPTRAVIETFKAGADIALMPITIRSHKDLARLHRLLDELERAVANKELNEDEVFASFERIRRVKAAFYLDRDWHLSISDKLKRADIRLRHPSHVAVEQELARAALTLVKGSGHLNPAVRRLHLVMPDAGKCQALQSALLTIRPELNISCSTGYETEFDKASPLIDVTDALLVANITPKQSPVEMGGMEDLVRLSKIKRDKPKQDKLLKQLLQYASEQGKQSLFVSLRAPYEIQDYLAVSSDVIATYAYNSHKVLSGDEWQLTGPSYQALAALLLDKIEAEGNLPVRINGI